MMDTEMDEEVFYPDYSYNQEVDLVIIEKTDLGYKVIINMTHPGLLYHNEIFRQLEIGEKTRGYIKEVREDGKIDVSLQKLGYEKMDGISKQILNILQQKGGYLPVHDKSDAEEIYSLFSCSKRDFKKAIGTLYKKHLIVLEPGGIRIVK